MPTTTLPNGTVVIRNDAGAITQMLTGADAAAYTNNNQAPAVQPTNQPLVPSPAYGPSGNGVVSSTGQVVSPAPTTNNPNIVNTVTATGDTVTYDQTTGQIITSTNPNTPIAPNNGSLGSLTNPTPPGSLPTSGTGVSSLSPSDADINAVLDLYPNLSLEQKALLREFAKAYQGGLTDTEEILRTFNEIRGNTIDPYFDAIINNAIKDVTFSRGQLDAARTAEIEQENLTKLRNIENAQAGLESSGMTFSGQAVKDLGATSGYAQNENPTIPKAAQGIEGLVPTANRLMSSSSSARYTASQREQARQLENQIGTDAAIAALGGSQYVAGGISGENSSTGQSKNSMYGSVLSNLISQYQQKRNLTTNQ